MCRALEERAPGIVPDMPSRLCPYRKTVADLAPIYSTTAATSRASNGSPRYIARIVCACANCKELSTVVVPRHSTATPGGTSGPELRQVIATGSNLTWSPLAASAPDYPRVPDHVARSAREAHMAHGIGADAASILMTRTTIEATAKSKDITSGNLFTKIEAMAETGIIRRDAVHVAHAIRHLGNNMAHGDVEDPPTPEDASDALQLMDMILSEVFQAANLAQEILARRTKG